MMKPAKRMLGLKVLAPTKTGRRGGQEERASGSRALRAGGEVVGRKFKTQVTKRGRS